MLMTNVENLKYIYVCRKFLYKCTPPQNKSSTHIVLLLLKVRRTSGERIFLRTRITRRRGNIITLLLPVYNILYRYIMYMQMSRLRNTKNVIRTCVETISKRRNLPYCYIYNTNSIPHARIM